MAVPFWWDGKRERCVHKSATMHVLRILSLVATIKSLRPDLLSDQQTQADPIPIEIPSHTAVADVNNIADIGTPTMASFMTNTNIDPSTWYLPLSHYPYPFSYIRWLFEKYDGIRAFWNPLKHAFYSRFGNQLTIPETVVNSMPKNVFLDGELWYNYPVTSLSRC